MTIPDRPITNRVCRSDDDDSQIRASIGNLLKANGRAVEEYEFCAPVSTSWPAYIVFIRSQHCETSAKSYEMKISYAPAPAAAARP